MIFPNNPPSNIMKALNWHMQYIAERMRPDEIQHWLAVSGAPSYDPEVAAAGFIATPGLKFSVLHTDGNPAIVGGFHEVSAGCWDGWMIGTLVGWEECWRSITKGSRWLIDELFASGARRVCISTIAERTEACMWYVDGLGLQWEGTHRRAGAHGEDIVFYSRITEDRT
jgi:hypothetical protein